MTSTFSQNGDEQKRQVQDYFARTAESYVASFSHKSGDDLLRLIEIGEWDKQQQALDIATGGGHTALAVAAFVGHITVTDLTERMLEKAREFLLAQGVDNASFQLADAERLPFADAMFDRVTCRIASHHFPAMRQSVREVARILKPGGIYLLIDCMSPEDEELDAFDNTIEKWRDASHGRSCAAREWQSFFENASLTIEYREFFRKSHQFDDWTLRAQLPEVEKTRLEHFILHSDQRIRDYFEVAQRADGHLERFTNDFILLKGRK